MIGEPPLLLDAVKLAVIDTLVAVRLRLVGAFGTPAVTVTTDVEDAAPVKPEPPGGAMQCAAAPLLASGDPE